jgi:uncharacterized phage protein (TIGR02218 family)
LLEGLGVAPFYRRKQMTDWFAQPLTTLAFAWRVERRDGITLGFTSHDRDLNIDSLIHRAAPGMLPSAIERSDGLDADDVQLSAALTSDAFTDADLMAGRWDGAALTLSAVDWTAPNVAPVVLLTGEFGEVEIKDGGFAVGLRGPTAVLEAAVVEETSPECRAQLGDRRCRVDLSGRRASAVVVSVVDSVVTLASPLANGDFAYGSLRWLTGANAGLESRVVANAGASVTLRDVPAFAGVAGTRVELVEGCDKRFATCVGRFGNAVNFRGEPHLPGNDLLTRYGD